MNYKELFEFEHKILPFVLLSGNKAYGSIINHFAEYAAPFCPSFDSALFSLAKDKLLPEHISSFLKKGDKVVVFSFPFQQDYPYIGLADYGCFIYKPGYLERRFVLSELFSCNTGLEHVLWYYPVEYSLLGEKSKGYSLQRKVYTDKIWFGEKPA